MRNWETSHTGRNHCGIAILSILISILLSSCATLLDPESSQEYNLHQIGVVNPTTSIGQSIRPTNGRLNGITFWFSKPEQNNGLEPGKITIDIYKNLIDNKPVFTTSLSTISITQFTPIQITLPVSTVPEGNPVYVEISSSDDEVIVHGRLEDNYPNGQAYQNRQAFNADLAFRVTYYYGYKEFALDITGLAPQVNNFFLALEILLIPGYAMVRLFNLHNRYPAAEQLSFSVGMSIATIPIIYLYTTNLGISLTHRLIQVIGLMFLLIIIATWVKDRSYLPVIRLIKQPNIFIQRLIHTNILQRYLPFSLLLCILVITLIGRIVMVRDLATPAWVDSIHHGLITRLILVHGTLPQNYQPYMDIESTLYHPGFHSTLATFINLSGMNIQDGMLFWGQILNPAMALGVYLLAVTLSRKQSVGLFAALIASTFTAMPAYYTSWGRYPQLSGLIILPIPFALFIATDNHMDKKATVKLLLCGAIAITGLFLVHYRVVAFLACLFIAWIITKAIQSRSNVIRFTIPYINQILVLIMLTLLISSAWLLPALRDTILPRVSPNNASASLNFFSDFSWHYLTPIFGKHVIAMAALGILWALYKNNALAGTIVGWVVLLFFLANLSALNLPGGSFINNSSVTIMLFMPLSVAAGYLIDQVAVLWNKLITNRSSFIVYLTILAITAIPSLKGSQQLLSILNPTTLLSRQADLTAINWIDDNIPDEEIILINPFFWGYGLFAGSDGGAWISTIAGNQTVPPPVLYGLGSETQKEYTNQICSEVIRLGSSPEELWNYLLSTDIEYIYTGARGGVISSASLSDNPHFEVVYHRQNTWLFRIIP